MRYQKADEAQTFSLTVTSELRKESNTFSILSRREEAQIEKELQSLDDEYKASNPLRRFVGRSNTLISAHLFGDLADEYDAVLKLFPDSEVLLSEALAANQRTGNLARIHEIKGRLQAASSEGARSESESQ
jgi:hypothetical protein